MKFVTLPTPYIKLYDEDGKLTGYDHLDHEPMDTTTTETDKNDTAQQQKYQTHRVISQVQLA